MERMQGEAQNAYTVAVAATEKFCEQNNVIMKITESFPFVVHFTVDAPLTLLETNSGELIAPQIIVTVGIDSTVKSRADKAIETALLKKLIKNAEGLANLFFCRTAESVYEGVTITTSQLTEAQRVKIEEQIQKALERQEQEVEFIDRSI